MNKDYIKPELQNAINEGKGCIIFDFGCYCPDVDVNDLIFTVAINDKMLENSVLNKRYINKHYKTISKKSGRSISKLGYPYFFDIEQMSGKTVDLSIDIGVTNNVMTLVFPLMIPVTKDNPVCKLDLRYILASDKLVLTTYEPCGDGGWCGYSWKNYRCDNDMIEQTCYLSRPETKHNMSTYHDIIKPKACKLHQVFVYN